MADGATESHLRRAMLRASAHGLGIGASRNLRAPDDLLRFLCDRIDATILERRLVFQLDGAPWLDLLVTGRRLLSVSPSKGSAAHGLRCAFTDIEDAELLDGKLHDLQQALVAASSGANRVTVQPIKSGSETNGPGQGVSARRLRDAFRIGSGPTDAAALFHRFVDEAQDDILCAAYLDDDLLYPIKATDAELDRLATLSEEFLGTIEDTAGDLTTLLGARGLLCSEFAPGAGPPVLVGMIDARILCALAEHGASERLARLWYATLDT